MNRQRFGKGSGVFQCECCARVTRNSAAVMCGAVGVDKTCEDCYELAGIYNVLQDGGDLAPYAAEVRERCQKIQAAGGKLDGDAQELLAAVGA